jgi:hypothetical protein
MKNHSYKVLIIQNNKDKKKFLKQISQINRSLWKIKKHK